MKPETKKHMLDNLISNATQEELESFNHAHFIADTAIIEAMTAIDDPNCPESVIKSMPTMLQLISTMMKISDVDREDIVCRICAKHLALRSIREGDLEMIKAYGEIEYAHDVIKKDLSSK